MDTWQNGWGHVMQSQQKRVKWSRGETAEALEERTDTGITQASVSFMENCIPDMYGNVSRRPGLKCIPYANTYSNGGILGFSYDEYLQVFPFYITENDYILVGVHLNAITELIRVKNGTAVYYKTTSTGAGIYPKTGVELGLIAGDYTYRPVSFAQQNNYMLIADGYNVYKLTFEFSDQNDYEFTPIMELWKFSAGWYAPNGTQTKNITNLDVANMSFAANTLESYVWVEPDGNTASGKWISTGISAATYYGTWTGTTTTYYCGFTTDNSFIITKNASDLATQYMSWSMTNGTNYTSGQQLATYTSTGIGQQTKAEVRIYLNGKNAYFIGTWKATGAVSSAYTTDGFSVSENMDNNIPELQQLVPAGSIIHFPNNGAYMRVEGYTSDTTNLRIYGEILTPVADDTATDTNINVETGFESLAPSEWNIAQNFPHPKKLVFCEQRLWAGAWAFTTSDEYSLTIGSQIARYNDLKNNYNQENEPITLDILTQYKERILHLVDYNGLKIMTDSFEYAYETSGIKKQSANGSFEYCEPLVFDSLCLYVDSTGCQVKAMQYEFTNNVFDSTTINQFAPHDLVWYPWAMAQYEDKVNNTGKYLFLVNREDGQARVAVCNFVPGNQANIWNRWSFPTFTIDEETKPLIHSVVNTKTGTLFMVKMNRGYSTLSGIITPAVLDFNAHTDFESEPITISGFSVKFYSPIANATIANAKVAIYADGVFQFMTTLNANGQISASLAGLNNVTAGLPINSKVISHPIDVGGKTKSIKKRIAKTVLSVHDTEPGAITINGKTGYMNPQKDKINFYGVTGMKDEIKYTLTNNNGAMFHLESLLMNIEYGTLIS